MLRWVSPLNNMFRIAVRDTEVNGQPIAEGERVALLYPAAEPALRARIDGLVDALYGSRRSGVVSWDLHSCSPRTRHVNTGRGMGTTGG